MRILARIAAVSLAPLAFITVLRGQDAAPAASDLLQRLKAHPHFATSTFRVEEIPSYRLLLPTPLADDEPQHGRTVLNSVLPHLNRLRETFDATYGAPNQLEPSAKMQPFAFAVLTTRDRYGRYAKTTTSTSRHHGRAHYEPGLQLLVTYLDPTVEAGFAAERRSVLHQFVVALQHAYSKTGAMPKPMWLVEGLAEYRSSHGNAIDSLTDPPLDWGNLGIVVNALANESARKLVLPLEQLLAITDSNQIVVAARMNGFVDAMPKPVAVFCAHSELLVRFLHVGEGGKHRAGFVRYFAAVAGGAEGLPAFREAFGLADAAALAGLDEAFRRWLVEVKSPRAGGENKAAAPLPPPIAFDPKPLAWQDADFAERLALVRRHCRAGDFAAALAALPTSAPAEERQRLDAERLRVQQLAALRDKLAQKLTQAKGEIDLGGSRGRFVRLDGNQAVLAGKGGEQRVPFDAKALLTLGLKDKAFERNEARHAAWLHWLAGDDAAAQAVLQQGKTFQYSWSETIGAEIGKPLPADAGLAAAELAHFQALAMPSDRALARQSLERLRATVSTKNPVWIRRVEHLTSLVQALAERAFAPDDPIALGIRGTVTPQPDGRVKVTYPEPAAAPNADFRVVEQPAWSFDDKRPVAYDGPPTVRAAGTFYEAIGSGFVEWAVPLVGPHEVEFEFQLPQQDGDIFLFVGVGPGRSIRSNAQGTLAIDDAATGLHAKVAGKAPIYPNKPHRVRLVNDGAKSAAIFVDGKEQGKLTALGACTAGSVVVGIKSGDPILLRGLTILGKLQPPDLAAARERYVGRWQGEVWLPLPAPAAAADATAKPKPVALGISSRRSRLDPRVATAVGAGLEWLAKHQDADGRWDTDNFMKHDGNGVPCDGPGRDFYDVGVTALATLALLGDGSTTETGPYGDNVRRAVDWLLRNQDISTGALDRNHTRFVIGHALALTALAEAAQASDQERLRDGVAQAVGYLEKHRNPYGVWQYAYPPDGSGSQFATGFCTEALVAAGRSGASTPTAALSFAAQWQDQISDPTGAHGYAKPGERSVRYVGNHAVRFPVEKGEATTAMGLWCRFLLGQDPRQHPIMVRSADLVLAKPPLWDPKAGCIDEVYWFYGTNALYRMGGKHWLTWYTRLQSATLPNQRQDGNAKGSWDPIGAWSDDGGRVTMTAFLTLSLMTPARLAATLR